MKTTKTTNNEVEQTTNTKNEKRKSKNGNIKHEKTKSSIISSMSIIDLPDLLILCMSSSLFNLQHFVDVQLQFAHKAVDPNEAEKVFVATLEWMLIPVMEERHRYTASVKFTCMHHVIHCLNYFSLTTISSIKGP